MEQIQYDLPPRPLGGMSGVAARVSVRLFPAKIFFAPDITMASPRQTDRQTNKAVWWSVTAFKDVEIDTLSDQTKWPPEVSKVYGGLEECPETKRKHFQGAVQFRQQVRMSQVKAFLPTAHLEPARAIEALKKYAMKAETAIGEKTVRENKTIYFPHHELCMLLASEADYALDDEDAQYWCAVRSILPKHPTASKQLESAALRSFWIKTRYTWLEMFKAGRANSITPGPAEPAPSNLIIDGVNAVDEVGYESDKSDSTCPDCGRCKDDHHSDCDNLISHQEV